MKDNIREYLSELFGKKDIDKLYKSLSTREISTSTEKDLVMHGVNDILADKIHTVFKIRHASNVKKSKQLTESTDSYQAVKDLAGLDHEQFDLLLLDKSNRLIKRVCHSKCGLGGTLVDVKLILIDCLRHKASSLILAHNHPSGNLTPSSADKQITKKIIKACKQLDIMVLDHIIVGAESGYTSMQDEGLMY